MVGEKKNNNPHQEHHPLVPRWKAHSHISLLKWGFLTGGIPVCKSSETDLTRNDLFCFFVLSSPTPTHDRGQWWATWGFTSSSVSGTHGKQIKPMGVDGTIIANSFIITTAIAQQHRTVAVHERHVVVGRLSFRHCHWHLSIAAAAEFEDVECP